MTTLEMFIEAAKALQKDPIYTEVERLQTENDNDVELVKRIEEFNTARGELTNMMTKEGEPNPTRVAELNNKVREMYTDIMGSKGMLEYSEAKTDLDLLVSHIQAVLDAALNGEDPATAEPKQQSCGGGSCSSCAGCG